MPKLQHIAAMLPEPGGQFTEIVNDQDVFDIMREIRNMHREAAPQYDVIAPEFWAGNAHKTAQKIFTFCKQIPYREEPKTAQTVKTPAQIISDGMAGNIASDCKHYALMCCGIADALNRAGYPIKARYRFASDRPGDRYPRHVFAIITDERGCDIWCDPVLGKLNQYHQYYVIKDRKCPPMALYKVSGITPSIFGYDEAQMMGKTNIFKKVAHGLKVDAANAKHGLKVDAANAKKEIKKIQPGRLLLKATLVAQRNAFLLLLKLNIFDLAYNVAKYGQSEAGKNKLKNFWENLGGRYATFATNVNEGVKLYNKNHPAHRVNLHSIGDPETGVAAAIAAAMPIILAIEKLIGNLNISQFKRSEKGGIQALSITHNDTGGDHPDGTQTDVTTAPDGTQAMTVNKFGPDLEGATPAPGAQVLPSEQAEQYAADTETIKEADKELPGATSAPGKAVNVVTDWGQRAANWISKNKGLVITGAVVFGVVEISRVFAPTTKKRR